MFVDHNQPRSVGEAIGFAIMAFSQLEMMVNFHAVVTTMRTTRCGDESQALGRLLNYSAKVDLLESTLKLRAGKGELPEGGGNCCGGCVRPVLAGMNLFTVSGWGIRPK